MSSACQETSEKWLLIQWTGSFGEDAFDIINANDVVFDEFQTIEHLKTGSTVVVRCGNMKSPAHVILISDNTDYLVEERNSLKQGVLKERSQNIPTPKQSKKRRLKSSLSSSPTSKVKTVGTQTDLTFEGNTVFNLIKENATLKTQLQDCKNMLSSMCSNIKSIVNDAEQKTRTEDFPLSVNTENVENKENRKQCSCPVIKVPKKVLIGLGKTEVPNDVYNNVNWLSYTAATRKLLTGIFPREVLATHSLTGKPSPAFLGCDMPLKAKLDPVKVADIVALVSERCGVSDSMVRSAITTKCADENKMFKKRLEKK